MADWAQRRLPTKNTLGVSDAQIVEAAFREKIAAFGSEQPEDKIEAAGTGSEAVTASKDPKAVVQSLLNQEPSPVSRRMPAKTIRLRDKDHRKFVSTQPCLVCGRIPADPHHLRFAQPRALSRKVSDEFTVPVCRLHHRELHNHGDEKKWWEGNNINPLPMALNLWKKSQTENIAVLTRVPKTTVRILQPDLAGEINDCGGLPQAAGTMPANGGRTE